MFLCVLCILRADVNGLLEKSAQLDCIRTARRYTVGWGRMRRRHLTAASALSSHIGPPPVQIVQHPDKCILILDEMVVGGRCALDCKHALIDARATDCVAEAMGLCLLAGVNRPRKLLRFAVVYVCAWQGRAR